MTELWPLTLKDARAHQYATWAKSTGYPYTEGLCTVAVRRGALAFQCSFPHRLAQPWASMPQAQPGGARRQESPESDASAISPRGRLRPAVAAHRGGLTLQATRRRPARCPVLPSPGPVPPGGIAALAGRATNAQTSRKSKRACGVRHKARPRTSRRRLTCVITRQYHTY